MFWKDKILKRPINNMYLATHNWYKSSCILIFAGTTRAIIGFVNINKKLYTVRPNKFIIICTLK